MICSAAALQSVMSPRPSRTMRPSAMDCTTDRSRSSLARSASSARVRSAVTAASTSAVSAAVARNSWLESRLSVIDSRTNGPALCAVFQTVSDETTTSAVAAPRGPEAQRGPDEHGEDDVRNVALRRKLGEQHEGGQQRGPLEQAPAREPAHSAGRPGEDQRGDHQRAREVRSHHVRQTSANWSAPDDVPEAQRRGPEARADQRPHGGGGDKREHVAHPLQAASGRRSGGAAGRRRRRSRACCRASDRTRSPAARRSRRPAGRR